MRLRAWPLTHPNPAISRLMMSWFGVGKDNLKRVANDTSIPFVRQAAGELRGQSSRSRMRKEAEVVLTQIGPSVRDAPTCDRLADFAEGVGMASRETDGRGAAD